MRRLPRLLRRCRRSFRHRTVSGLLGNWFLDYGAIILLAKLLKSLEALAITCAVRRSSWRLGRTVFLIHRWRKSSLSHLLLRSDWMLGKGSWCRSREGRLISSLGVHRDVVVISMFLRDLLWWFSFARFIVHERIWIISKRILQRAELWVWSCSRVAVFIIFKLEILKILST